MNRFVNPVVKQFFKDRGVIVNEELYALSELLQWVFRSQIRNGKPIDLYPLASYERDTRDLDRRN